MGVGKAIRDLRVRLYGIRSQGQAARALSDLVGGPPIAGNQFSKWETSGEQPSRYALAAIAMLDRQDPYGALKTLTDAFESERIPPVDLPRTDGQTEGRVGGPTPHLRVQKAARDQRVADDAVKGGKRARSKRRQKEA